MKEIKLFEEDGKLFVRLDQPDGRIILRPYAMNPAEINRLTFCSEFDSLFKQEIKSGNPVLPPVTVLSKTDVKVVKDEGYRSPIEIELWTEFVQKVKRQRLAVGTNLESAKLDKISGCKIYLTANEFTQSTIARNRELLREVMLSVFGSYFDFKFDGYVAPSIFKRKSADNSSTQWTDEDIDITKQMYRRGIPPVKIAKIIGRTNTAVSSMIHLLRKRGEELPVHSVRQQEVGKKLAITMAERRKLTQNNLAATQYSN